MTDAMMQMNDDIARMDAARIGPHVTCPASRHAAMIAKALINDRSTMMLDDDPAHCGGSIAAVVASLWEARAATAAKEKP